MADEKPIIVVKKKGGHGGHHGGAWKVAFADFMTALMAFFLVMWLVNSAETSTKQSIAKYFRRPGLFDQGSGSPLLIGQAGILDEAFVPQRTRDERDYKGKGENPQADKAGAGGQGKQAGGEVATKGSGAGTAAAAKGETAEKAKQYPPRAQRKQFEQIAAQIRQQAATIPNLKSVLGELEVKIESDGLVIEVMDSAAGSMFQPGSTVITPPAREAFMRVAQILAPLPNKIDVIGHTDAKPYSVRDRGYSNWELSSDRANAARRLLTAGGIAEERVVGVIGRADKDLRIPERPDAVENRRITLKMRYSEDNKAVSSALLTQTPTPTPESPPVVQSAPPEEEKPEETPAKEARPKIDYKEGPAAVPLPPADIEENPSPVDKDTIFKGRPVLGKDERFLPF